MHCKDDIVLCESVSAGRVQDNPAINLHSDRCHVALEGFDREINKSLPHKSVING